MTDREIMQQALEALQTSVPTHDGFLSHCKTMNHLRIRLAQPEQDDNCKHCTDGCPACDAAFVAAAERDRLAQPEQEPMFDCPRCGHCCSQRKPLTDDVHNAFLQGIRYAANKYEAVSDERFTGNDVSNFLLMEAEELDSSDITRAIEAAHGIKGEA